VRRVRRATCLMMIILSISVFVSFQTYSRSSSCRLSFGAMLYYTILYYTDSILYNAGNAAIFDYATGGPFFGASDLIFGEPQAAVMGGFAGPSMENAGINAGNLKRGRSSIGFSYQLPVDGKKWPVRGEFQVVQLEVYCNSATISDATTSASPSWWPF
jgi:hypothetical protein